MEKVKATLCFELPQEQEEHRLALDGGAWKSVVHNIDDWLRSQAKYGEKPPSMSEIRREFYEIIAAAGVEL